MSDFIYFMILLGLFVGLGLLIAILWGIIDLVYYIKNRRWKKWCNFVYATYPELKVLLAEWSRLRKERCETVKDAVKLQKDIDEWTEKNKYLPHSHRVDGHIEALKEHYQELLEIQGEYGELVDKAKKELDKFWETNFPNLPEHKRIMWWSE